MSFICEVLVQISDKGLKQMACGSGNSNENKSLRKAAELFQFFENWLSCETSLKVIFKSLCKQIINTEKWCKM